MPSLAATYAVGLGRVRIRLVELVVLLAAVLGIAGAEALLAFGSVLAGQIFAAVLVPVLLFGLPERRGAPARSAKRVNLALRALALVPLTRVITTATAHPEASRTVTVLALGVMTCWLALAAAPALQIERRALVAVPLQPFPVLTGYVLSFVAYLAGAPALAAPGASPTDLILASVAVMVAAAAEELLFRGVLQGSLQRAAARPGVLMGVALFPCMYLGFGSTTLVLVMLLAGLLFATAVLRTGATGAVIIGHAGLAFGAAVVWPYVLGREHAIGISDGAIAAVVTVAVLAALPFAVRGRGSSLSVRTGRDAPPAAAADARSDDWIADA
jgi:membrane protease YdiL (CAAX protease family)